TVCRAQAVQPRMARKESVSHSRQPSRRIIISEKARLSGWVSSRLVTLSTSPRQAGPLDSRRAGMTFGGNMISVLTYIAATLDYATNQITTPVCEIIESGGRKSNRGKYLGNRSDGADT